MNTQQIDRFLRQRLPDFDGVFSIDTLPEHLRLLVCNTDPSNEPGRHWVAMCVRDGRGEFSIRSDVHLMLFSSVI